MVIVKEYIIIDLIGRIGKRATKIREKYTLKSYK